MLFVNLKMCTGALNVLTLSFNNSFPIYQCGMISLVHLSCNM